VNELVLSSVLFFLIVHLLDFSHNKIVPYKGDISSAYRILNGKCKGKRSPRRPRHWWENVDWAYLAHDSKQLLAGL
jgi:hypothetical protein